MSRSTHESKLWRDISERCLTMARMKEHNISAPYLTCDMAKRTRDDIEELWAIDSVTSYDDKLKTMLKERMTV